jgi:hypothetical protein
VLPTRKAACWLRERSRRAAEQRLARVQAKEVRANKSIMKRRTMNKCDENKNMMTHQNGGIAVKTERSVSIMIKYYLLGMLVFISTSCGTEKIQELEKEKRNCKLN